MERLQSVYIQMDSDAQTLSDNARAQFLIKALYKADKPSRKNEIIDIYTNVLGLKKVNTERLCTIIDELASKDVILQTGEKYSLRPTDKKKIQAELIGSESRTQNIISHYFSGLNSTKEAIEDWLIDSTVAFFSSFSNAWISDLTSKEKAIESKRVDIIKQIDNRTRSNKAIDKRDREVLSQRFFQFITTNHPDVIAYLWEYGTSAFSAKLIKNTSGADELSLNLFKDCQCILDTNILIDVALEGNERHDAMDALSEIFKDLNTSVHTLKITRDEYHNKVNSKAEQIKRLSYGSLCKALTKADDQFMKTAAIRGCEDADDFDRFFQTLNDIPDQIGNNVDITDYPEGPELSNAITTAQSDESLIKEYKTLYFDMHGFEKRPEPLAHDLGLIGAALYLTKSEKVFLLSDDPTLNQYAKRKPFAETPFSIRLDTLINVLALKQGGLNGRNLSFQAVFANIVRNGFTPRMNTFNVEDLAYMYEKNVQVASLSEDRVEEIARSINRMRLSDVSDKEVSHALMRFIQGEKIRIQGEYDIIKDKYIIEHAENEENKKGWQESESQLNYIVTQKAKTKYKRNIWGCSVICFILVFIVIPGVVYLVSYLIPYLQTDNNNRLSLWVNLASDVLFDAIIIWKLVIPKWWYNLTHKEECIEKYIKEDLDNAQKNCS